MANPITDQDAYSDPEKVVQEVTKDHHNVDTHLTADVSKAELGRLPMLAETNLPMPEIPLTKIDSKLPPKEDELEDPFRHLPEHEAAILRKQIEIPKVKVSWFTLFRYASKNDLILLVISVIASIIAGAALPLMTIIFGRLTGDFSGFFNGGGNVDSFRNSLVDNVLYFVYLAIGMFVFTYISTVGFIYVGEHITGRTREHYLAAVLRSNIAYFDKLGAGEITTRITADMNAIQDGISEKVGLTLTAVATFVSAFVIGFIYYWKLTLILTSTVFALVFTMGGVSKWLIEWTAKSQEAYAKGGTVAEEVLSSIRNATAFNTQEKLARQYDQHLKEAEKWGKKMQVLLGMMIAIMMTIVYLNYSLTFWQGSRYLVDGQMDVKDILIILFAIIIGAFALGNVAPNGKAFTSAVAAGHKIFSTIDRVSPIDSESDEGKKLESVVGTVELQNIKHIYPSRPEVVVMDGVSLMVPAGKTTALVGASGSGKSTIIGLVERFYDPVGGSVLLDGIDVRELNVRSLRQYVSLVQQEPVLFATTIANNIKHGLIGTQYEDLDEEKTQELVIESAKMANAHEFISALPEGYKTNVGERGFLLSGGQKQRIAIARAMVSDPKILLLDEATSALDTKSEGVVQAALDRAAQGRTTIVIAHRLSTIKHADNIVVMSQGQIVEQGTHDELLEKKTAYYNLVEAQKILAAARQKEEERENDAESILDELEKKQSLVHSLTKEKTSDLSSDPDDNIPPRLERTHTTKSVSSRILAGKKERAVPKYSLWTLLKVVGSFNRTEKGIMLFGFFWCVIAGGGNPTQAIFFAKAIQALSLPPSMYGKLRHDIDFWCWMYFMLAGSQLISMGLQGACLGYGSEKLIHRARLQSFRHMLRQDIQFFDREENNAGALTTFLSTETTHLAGLSGPTLGTILSVSTTLIASVVLAIAIGWKLGLVCSATLPVLLACGFFRFWMLARFQARAKKAYENSASYACEATSAIRTVASLTREKDVWNHYHDKLVDQERSSLISILKSSTLYASSQSLMFLCNALGFWYGGTLIASGEYTVFQFFVCFTAVIFGGQSAGTIFSFAPDMGKAKHAAAQLKQLFDTKPEIDSWSQEGEKVPTMEGAIEFRDVHFRYPTRPEQPVLRGLNITVKPGQYVALVGASGCGKSTSIALLERFYDPIVGSVRVDGNEISKLNLNEYRSYLALVSQEPTLYQGTIRENILLGADREDVGDDEIERACRDANIYDFIMSLPDGFNTVAGAKGALLSGGQKQRVAIARALLRNPRILLLDEATSALDSESEKVVQAALDKAAKGRTTIAVAHRLSTIQKADVIYVIDGGRVAESGTHEELVRRKGRYFELVNLQSLGKMS